MGSSRAALKEMHYLPLDLSVHFRSSLYAGIEGKLPANYIPERLRSRIGGIVPGLPLTPVPLKRIGTRSALQRWTPLLLRFDGSVAT